MNLVRFKDALHMQFGGFWGSDATSTTPTENLFHIARVANFNMDRLSIDWSRGETIRDIDLAHQISKKVEFGDIILEKSGGGENQPVGRAVTYLSDIPSTAANFTNILKPSCNFDGRYLTYCFEKMNGERVQAKHIKQNTGIQNLDVPAYLCEHFHAPELVVQKSIASDLDAKINSISNSIFSLKQKLIHLDEYKVALIHKAVTKGLDAKGCRILDGTPAAQVKWRKHIDVDGNAISDSGIVQAHWDDIKLKDIFSRKNKIQNMGLECGSISFGVVVTKDSERIPTETKLAYQEVLSGEYLINPLNLNFDLKSLRTAMSGLDVVVSSGYIVLQKEGDYDSEYLQWLLRVFDVVKMKTLGGGVRQTVTFNDIGKCWSSIPDIFEQGAIATYIKTTNIAVIEYQKAINKKIDLLNEYKKSLINEAVSGDVVVNETEVVSV